MMPLTKIIASVVVVLGSMGFIGFSQSRIDALHEEALEDELLYIPSNTLLTHFTAGMSNVVADMLWIETIQYTVKEFHDPQRKFTWLEQMCHAVTDLDPYFEGVYVNGGMFLSSVGADEKALKLLKKGFVRNPESWEIPYEMVKVYVLNRRDQPQSPAITTHYLRMLAERHEHPEMYLSWARRIQEQNDLKKEGRAIWEDVIKNSKDKFVRELYPGTETPKAFESYVTKIEGDSHEKLKIHMNHPLRHRGYTFFQASFGADQTGAAEFFSVFSVVRNPADQVPLVACIVISIGLIIHFSQKLFRYLQVENKRRKA